MSRCCFIYYVFKRYAYNRNLHSFPTRLSSDLFVAHVVGHRLVVGPPRDVNRPRYDEHVLDRKSTRLNSSNLGISYADVCLKRKSAKRTATRTKERQSKPSYAKTKAVCRYATTT